MPDLMAKLDWFAFTFPITLLGENDNENTLEHIFGALALHAGKAFAEIHNGHLWEWQSGRGFYTHSIRHPKLLTCINWSAGNPFAQCELSGQAVDMVLSSHSCSDLAVAANNRCTRMDIAIDIETDIRPEEFALQRNENRILASDNKKSATGETFYVGSRSSERMARVYRYYPPHPRAHLLRIEVELKGDAAKMVCAEMITGAFRELSARVNLPFGWMHPIWNTGNLMLSKIPARKYDNEGAGTLRWLSLTVAPALKSAHQSGLIDLETWIDEYLRK